MSKTLYVETNEEITSVIDRIKNIDRSEVVLVIPKKAAILQSILNLKILRKQLNRLGKEAIIVTSDKLGRNLASRADFIVKQKLESETSVKIENPINHNTATKEPESGKLKVLDIIKKGSGNTFIKPTNPTDGGHSVSSAIKPKKDKIPDENTVLDPEETLDSSVRNKTKKVGIFAEEPAGNKKIMILPGFGKKLLLIISFTTLLVTAIVLFLVLPTAAIIVEPKTQLITQEIDLIVDKSIENIDNKDLKIPGDLIEVSKEMTREFSATGKKDVQEKSSGVITIYNDWDSQSQTLVENTRFISDNGKLFKSNATVVVPGFKRLSGQDIPGTATVKVIADEPGEESNIEASRFSIPGLKGTVKYEKIYGLSTEPMAGGRVEQVTVVGNDDFDKAKKTIEKELREQVINEIKGKSNGQTTITEDAIFLNKSEFTSSKKTGEEAKNFSITLKINGSAITFNQEDVMNLAKENMKVPFGKYTLIDDPKLTYGKSDPDLKSGKMSVKVYSETMVASKIDKNDILGNVKGKSAEDLKKYFANISEVGNVNVRFWPSWVKSIPRIESKVNIDIK